jgi:hypothetical protein
MVVLLEECSTSVWVVSERTDDVQTLRQFGEGATRSLFGLQPFTISLSTISHGLTTSKSTCNMMQVIESRVMVCTVPFKVLHTACWPRALR